MNAITVSLFVTCDDCLLISAAVMSLVADYGLKTWGDFDITRGVTGWTVDFGLAGDGLTTGDVDALFSNVDLADYDVVTGWVAASDAPASVLSHLN